jgi:hypothetical protein
MPRHLYTGPEDQRGHVPSWGFDDGVLAPDEVRALISRGHLVDPGGEAGAPEAGAPPAQPTAPARKPAARKAR